MNNSPVRHAVDITKLKIALTSYKDLDEVVSAIRRFEASESILADLREANLAVEAIAEVQLNPPLRQRFGAALMTHAIVTYCRATHSKADARWNVGITKNYTSDQMQKHRKIADLRDTVIAHFGFPAEDHGAKWHEERAVTKIVDGVETNSFVWRRANYLGAAVTDLRELIITAIETGRQLVKDRGNAMTQAILKHIHDARVLSAIQSFPFDPYEFWGPGEAANTFWEDKQGGQGQKTETFVYTFQTSGKGTASD